MDDFKLNEEITGADKKEQGDAAGVADALKAAQNSAAEVLRSAQNSGADAAPATEKVVEVAVAEPVSYIKTDDKWKDLLSDLQKEVESELKKANDTVTELLETEKKKAADTVEKELTEKLENLKKEKDVQIEKLTAENEELKKGFDAKKDELKEEIDKEASAKQEAEIASLKAQYEQQIDSIQNANREKLQAMRKEMDGYKEQIETLMLHIDDPFVLQEIQNGKQAGGEAADTAENKETE